MQKEAVHGVMENVQNQKTVSWESDDSAEIWRMNRNLSKSSVQVVTV